MAHEEVTKIKLVDSDETCLSYSLWNYEWYVDLWTMFTNILFNEEMIKIKVVDSDEFNNFMFTTFVVEII